MRKRLALPLSVALIILAVFPWRGLQDHAHWSRVGWIPYLSAPLRLRDIIQNVLLFMPLGFTLGRRGKSLAAVAGIGLAISLLGELTQVYSHGRIPAMTDVFNDFVGVCLGHHLARRRAAKAMRFERFKTPAFGEDVT